MPKLGLKVRQRTLDRLVAFRSQAQAFQEEVSEWEPDYGYSVPMPAPCGDLYEETATGYSRGQFLSEARDVAVHCEVMYKDLEALLLSLAALKEGMELIGKVAPPSLAEVGQ